MQDITLYFDVRMYTCLYLHIRTPIMHAIHIVYVSLCVCIGIIHIISLHTFVNCILL